MHPETLNPETSVVFEKIRDLVGKFYLAGGTALALELGHRISVDLNFFSPEIFSTEQIATQLASKGRLQIDSQSEDTLNGSLDGVKVSFFRYPYQLLFQLKEYNNVRLADERDIAAMKILAISSRGAKKDFVDLFVLLRHYPLIDILQFVDHKYRDHHYNVLHILKSLTYFEDADEEPEPVYTEIILWDDVKKRIKHVVDEYVRFQSTSKS